MMISYVFMLYVENVVMGVWEYIACWIGYEFHGGLEPLDNF